MALLGASDLTPMRKSRHNSMLILRAASQLNLSEDDKGNEPPTQHLLECHDRREQYRKELTHKNTSNTEVMVIWLSALYGKLLIVIGMGFPVARLLSPELPLIYYNSFYLYLYFGSILFVLFAYVSLLSSFTMQLHNFAIFIRELIMYMKPFVVSFSDRLSRFRDNFRPVRSTPLNDSEGEPHQEESDSCHSGSEYSSKSSSLNSGDDVEVGGSGMHRSKFVYTQKAGHGSMYLKMGTIIFGIGSMIYSGLEFGHYFELRQECSDILMAITPTSRMVFTFIQMYFVFMNSRVSVSRHTTIARFGFMHMVATNLCIWLNILVEETKHTIHHISHREHDDHHKGETHHGDPAHGSSGFDGNSSFDAAVSTSPLNDLSLSSISRFVLYNDSLSDASNAIVPTETSSTYPYTIRMTEGLFTKGYDSHSMVKRASEESEECRNFNLMGDMVNSAAPLLFPCTIEYSLLCASVLYIMWKNVLTEKDRKSDKHQNEISLFIAKKVRHLYSVDCGRASRGLFTGIFVLVLTLISLILFYVLISSPNFKIYGIISAYSSEILIYSIGIVATIIGMKQMQKLDIHEEEESDLDNILLVVSQGGIYMFTLFTLIGGYFSKESMSSLSLITALITLLQATLQTIYILEGSRRCCKTSEHLDRKYGREMVTFLLVLNLSMWLFTTFQTSRTYMHIAQQEFYGIWAWTIISHVSMPLAIFYRFHATVCLGEIWKRAYKLSAEV